MDDMNTKMPERRKLEIKALLEKEKMVSINRLSEVFGISYLTVRRDLEKLEEEGIIKKVHGGAMLIKGFEPEPVFHKQKELYKDEKSRIAAEASSRIKDGDFIIIESGSTALELVKYLENKKNLKVTTAGMPILVELWSLANKKRDIEVIACGGILRPEVSTFVGSYATNFFKGINVDIAFVGAQALSIDKGISTATFVDADIFRAVVENANKVILLCDSSKFETRSYVNVAPVSSIDEIITDSGIDKDILKKIKKSGINITIV
jgi:DeoR family transcriptional regulator, fructose operon transcriptional repressor